MIKKYKEIILAIFFMTNLVYAEKAEKLKAEIDQKENKIVIKISKDNETLNEIEIDKNNERAYKIKKGDTLSQIALEYKKSIKKLAEDNNIKHIDLIITGKTLIIK